MVHFRSNRLLSPLLSAMKSDAVRSLWTGDLLLIWEDRLDTVLEVCDRLPEHCGEAEKSRSWTPDSGEMMLFSGSQSPDPRVPPRSKCRFIVKPKGLEAEVLMLMSVLGITELIQSSAVSSASARRIAVFSDCMDPSSDESWSPNDSVWSSSRLSVSSDSGLFGLAGWSKDVKNFTIFRETEWSNLASVTELQSPKPMPCLNRWSACSVSNLDFLFSSDMWFFHSVSSLAKAYRKQHM